jgi:hypothetical protein
MNKTLMLVLCGLPLAASAQIYKWTDDKGQVHFSQNPPKTGEYTDVTPTAPVSGTEMGPRSPARLAPRGGSSSGGLPPQTNLQARADDAERCAKANERISFLQEKTAHRLFVTGDDGQPARMTDEQFDEQLKDAQEAAGKYCTRGAQ